MTGIHSIYREKKTRKMHIFCTLYSLLPLADTLNGFVIQELHSSLSVGQLYRFLLIAVILMQVFSYKKVSKKDFVPLLMIACSIILLCLIHLFLGRNLSDELSNGLQWLLFPIFVFGFSILDIHGQLYEEDREKILEIWQWFFPLTILVPKLLGGGYYTYGGNIGYKGFYYANNGVSFALSILVIYSLYRFCSELSIRDGIKFALCAWSCITIGTKSALIAIAVAVVFLLFDKLNWKHFKRLLVIAVVFIAAYFLFQSFIEEKINAVIERYNYFNRMVFNNDFVATITSGRTGKADELWAQMQDGRWGCYLFGLGNTNYVAEMDFLDLFFQFGIFGVLAFVIYAVFLKKDIFKSVGIYKRLIVVSVIYAIIVGHVFNNSMSTMVLVLIFVSISRKKQNEGEAGK